MNSQELADYLHVRVRTLDNWAYQGKGPTYIQVEGQRLYRRSDVEQYLNERTVRRG